MGVRCLSMVPPLDGEITREPGCVYTEFFTPSSRFCAGPWKSGDAASSTARPLVPVHSSSDTPAATRHPTSRCVATTLHFAPRYSNKSTPSFQSLPRR